MDRQVTGFFTHTTLPTSNSYFTTTANLPYDTTATCCNNNISTLPPTIPNILTTHQESTSPVESQTASSSLSIIVTHNE
jgi:hypothetical protein